MFLFFSNRTGCLGSLLISLVGTAILLLTMRACGACGGGVPPADPPAPSAPGGW